MLCVPSVVNGMGILSACSPVADSKHSAGSLSANGVRSSLVTDKNSRRISRFKKRWGYVRLWDTTTGEEKENGVEAKPCATQSLRKRITRTALNPIIRFSFVRRTRQLQA